MPQQKSSKESIYEYVETLKLIKENMNQVEAIVSATNLELQSTNVPYKNDDLEMEYSAMLIRFSTILSSIDRVKESVKNSATEITGKLNQNDSK